MDQMKTNSCRQSPRDNQSQSATQKDESSRLKEQSQGVNNLPERRPVKIETFLEIYKNPEAETITEIPTSILLDPEIKAEACEIDQLEDIDRLLMAREKLIAGPRIKTEQSGDILENRGTQNTPPVPVIESTGEKKGIMMDQEDFNARV